MRREELAELLWADRLPDSWAASLSAVISRLRRLLTEAGLDGAEAIVSTAGAYQLVLPRMRWWTSTSSRGPSPRSRGRGGWGRRQGGEAAARPRRSRPEASSRTTASGSTGSATRSAI